MANLNRFWLVGLGAIILLPSLSLAAPHVPAPHVNSATLLARKVKGKVAQMRMRGRILDAALPSGIKQMFLRNIDRIGENGSRYGTYQTDSYRSFRDYCILSVSSVGPQTKRDMSWEKEQLAWNRKSTSFKLSRGNLAGDGKNKTVEAVILTPSVTLLKYGNYKERLVEHKDGKVLRTLPVVLGEHGNSRLGGGREKLLVGGYTLEQAFETILVK